MNPTISDTDGQTEGTEAEDETELEYSSGLLRSNRVPVARQETEPKPDSGTGTETEASRDARDATICVVGLGYVGLPLAVGFDRADYRVIGYDIDETKIRTLRTGVDTTGDVGDDAIEDGEVSYTTDAAAIADAGYVIVTVPTPIDDAKRPNLEFVEHAGRTVGSHLTAGTTVILESTVYPGATREVLVPAVEEESALTCGEDFDVAYSPERATPGDSEHTLESVVKVVGADDEDVLEEVASLYESVVDAGVYRAPSIEVAEACKVVENVQRDLNIALMNELSMVFDRLDIDTREVLEAAGTKWNFHDYRPGLVGGHCIPVDPYFLAHRASRKGFTPELLLTGREVNEAMPEHVARVTFKALNECDRTLGRSRVLLLGLTYKPDVADIRSSKAGEIAAHLREFDVDVAGYDPHGDDDAMREAFDLELLEELTFEGFDAVVVATGHGAFDELTPEEMAEELADEPALIDVAGAFDAADVTEAGIDYWGV